LAQVKHQAEVYIHNRMNAHETMQLVGMMRTYAASDISSNTRSLPETVSQISPKVPLSSVNPAARSSSKDLDPFRRPIWKQKANPRWSNQAIDQLPATAQGVEQHGWWPVSWYPLWASRRLNRWQGLGSLRRRYLGERGGSRGSEDKHSERRTGMWCLQSERGGVWWGRVGGGYPGARRWQFSRRLPRAAFLPLPRLATRSRIPVMPGGYPGVSLARHHCGGPRVELAGLVGARGRRVSRRQLARSWRVRAAGEGSAELAGAGG
jgi:hypothetical protein